MSKRLIAIAIATLATLGIAAAPAQAAPKAPLGWEWGTNSQTQGWEWGTNSHTQGWEWGTNSHTQGWEWGTN